MQIVPAGSTETQAFRLRRRVLLLIAVVAAVLLVAVPAVVIGSLGRREAVSDLARYRAENRELVRTLEALESREGELGMALDGLVAREQRFRVLAGLPLLDPDVYAVGVGGPGGTATVPEELFAHSPTLARAAGEVAMDLDQLLRRAELLGASLEEAADSVSVRRERFQRLPTIWPVVDPSSWISSGFSYNRLHPVLGLRRPHLGVDISAQRGSDVVSAGGGIVTWAGRKTGYGLIVEIDHGDGYETRYAHLAGISARQGTRVERGDKVGEVGQTGTATGPNLHYEVWVNGRAVNPVSYFLDYGYR